MFKYLAMFLSYLYDIFISKWLTIPVYQYYFSKHAPASLLDVGVGTGLPLENVMDQLQKTQRIVGYDINQAYVNQAKIRLQRFQNVKIQTVNIVEAQLQDLKQKFQTILFSFSFMLIPKTQHVLQVLRHLLLPNGKIVFFLTMEAQPSPIKQFLKPILKYLTSIDFGQVTYTQNFLKLMQDWKMKVDVRRVESGLIFKLFNVYIVEGQFTSQQAKREQRRENASSTEL